jgi:hypothetical protein
LWNSINPEGIMNSKMSLKPDVIKDRAEDIRQWLIECPITGTLVDADIGMRAVRFGIFTARRIEVKSCSLWPEKADCAQECIRN